MQTIINEYFLEIIGLIAAVTLITIFILISSSKKEKVKESAKKQPEAAEEPKKETVQKEPAKIEPSVLETAPEPEAEPEPEEQVQKALNRRKREVVPHPKITKDDFSAFKNTKVLVAEDNIINQKVITSLLSGSGINITIANDGQEALDILKGDKNFNVIFMDAHMPVLDGFQATRAIRNNPEYEHIPIVALSGDTAADDIKNMLNVGMEAHLEKPLKMDALYDILYAYTTGEEAQQQESEQRQEGHLEFDVQKGLEICGGDREFYIEILDDFLSKYSDSDKVLQEHINGTNGIDADKMLLDISGVAANIGAEALHDVAVELKTSIANPQDMTYISDLKKYKRALHKVCEAITEYKGLAV